MWEKIVGIFVCLLIIVSVSPVAGKLNSSDTENQTSYKWIIITLFLGKIKQLSEDIINDIVFYNFTAVDIFWLRIVYASPLWFNCESGNDQGIDNYRIPKALFYGKIQEGRISGMMINYGETEGGVSVL